ncbi:12454_t:CDS:2 [Acaulospora colombiana]|uniref:12454_t:CDS:1 n=1 Tax=Acaulospora colombiana TaxID=27376 RepID=A0ACA9KIY5_9GLOM|nr:12454_t:CDS:2 [Acaulospora colombiana]
MVQTKDSSNDNGIKDDDSLPISMIQVEESYMSSMSIIAMKGNKWQDKPKSMVQTEDSSNDDNTKDDDSLPISIMQDGESYVPRMEQKRKKLVIL